jgi:hypothetical protein
MVADQEVPNVPPEVPKQPADWLDGQGVEPEWPKDRPITHVCPRCDQEKRADEFDFVEMTPLPPQVWCADCRKAARHRPSEEEIIEALRRKSS